MVAKTKFRCAGDTHPGVLRQNNEDGLYFDPDRGIFFVVDGIGGQAAGEKATEVAVSRLKARLERQTGTPEERIREAIAVANNEILRLSATNPDWKGMACVLTVALVDEGAATIGHVGDSRLYKIHRGRIQKITHDHSPVGEREDRREISEAEAMRHPRRNEVYRDVGSEEHAPDDPDFIEVLRIPFEPDSALLLCSDGLSDQVTSGEILRAVAGNAGHPDAAVHELIAAANRAGGKDNVTVLIVEGEQFAAVRGAPQPMAKSGGHVFANKFAFLAYGLLCVVPILGALYALGWLAAPRTETPPPRIFHVRSGAGELTRIGDALAQARPGDTIEVAAGEYREELRLKDGVTLQSHAPDVPILRAPEGVGESAVAIAADGVHSARVLGFRILSDDQARFATGVLISNSGLELQDTEIAGSDVGVAISGASTAVLRADSIHDCVNAGIRISGTARPRLLYNTILRNGRPPHQPGPGIAIEEGAQPVLEGNLFADNGSEPVHFPEGMDGAAMMKFNFILTGKPPARQLPSRDHRGAVPGAPH